MHVGKYFYRPTPGPGPKPPDPTPTPGPSPDPENDVNYGLIFGLIAAGLVLIGIICAYIWYRKKKGRSPDIEDPDTKIKDFIKMEYEEATDN